MKKRSKMAIYGILCGFASFFFDFPINLILIGLGIYLFWVKGVFG